MICGGGGLAPIPASSGRPCALTIPNADRGRAGARVSSVSAARVHDDQSRWMYGFHLRLSATRQYRGHSRWSRGSGAASRSRTANAELKTLAAQFEREYPDFYSGVKGWQASPSDRGPGAKLRFTARPLHEEMTRDARPALILSVGRSGIRAADCLCECCEPDAGARFGAAAGV